MQHYGSSALSDFIQIENLEGKLSIHAAPVCDEGSKLGKVK